MHLIMGTGGSHAMTAIAEAAGFLYGTCHPDTCIREEVFFYDHEWKKPNRAGYMRALARAVPVMATVCDIMDEGLYREALSWAWEMSPHVEYVLFIPKMTGVIERLPRRVGGSKEVVLAFSVPTKYGGTDLPVDSFRGRPVHLLGGSPAQQVDYWRRFRAAGCEVVSVDGNYAQKMASRFCQFYYPQGLKGARNRTWPTLKEFDGQKWPGPSGPQEAFRRSCESMMEMWRGLRVAV